MGLVLLVLVFLHSTWIIQTWTLGERRKKTPHQKSSKQNALTLMVCLRLLHESDYEFQRLFVAGSLKVAPFLPEFFRRATPPRGPPPQFRPRRQIEAEDLVTPGIDPSSNTFKSEISSLEVRWVPFLLDLYIWCTHVQKEIRTFKVAVGRIYFRI